MRDEVGLDSCFPCDCLEILWVFLDQLNREGISYCYWKSTRRLPAVLAGESDLDLLIGRSDQHRLLGLLLDCGFKQFPNLRTLDDPAVISYLGYDAPSGRLVHVHLHMRIIAGAKLLPNYRLPFRERFLASAPMHPKYPVRVLDATTEAAILVIRACLELRPIDPMVSRHWKASQQKFILDCAYLALRVDRAALRAQAADLVGEGCADLVVGALFASAPLDRLSGLRRRIRKHLAAYRMYGPAEAGVRVMTRTAVYAAGKLNQLALHAPRTWRRRAPGGGIVVALLGVDGSGKSTAVRAVREWLTSEIDVMPIYFGTGDGRPSLLLLPFKLLVPVFTALSASRPKGSSHGNVTARPPRLIYTVGLAIWATVLACEKRLKLKAARRGADRGLVVITDRYPQNQIHSFNDGPLLPRLMWIPSWLRRFEGESYAMAAKLQPDLVIKLKANPELIAQREPRMDQNVIRQRVRELDELAFPNARVVSLDAAEPAADVARAIKHEIWQLL
jgi:thymidylate kinase